MKKFFLLGVAIVLFGVVALRAAEPAPTSARKFTYVIVHGAWAGAWEWKAVGDLLVADGHTVYRPTLTGQGERVHLANPDINLTTHITDVVNTILWENLHDVVLVGHSYGGAVITGVADRVADRLKGVIYLDAAVLNDGESFNTAFGRNSPADAGDGFVPVPGKPNPNAPIPHIVPHPAKTLSESVHLQNQEAVKKIPTAYVLFVPPGRTMEQAPFSRFYQRAKERGWTTFTLDSDHVAQVSHKMELVALLEKIP